MGSVRVGSGRFGIDRSGSDFTGSHERIFFKTFIYSSDIQLMCF